MKNLKTTTWLMVGDALQLGAFIVFAIIIGAAIGYYLDGVFRTFPILSIIFFFLGVAAAGRELWRVVQKQIRADEGKTGKEDANK